MQHITDEERRARLAARQLLDAPAGSVEDAADALVALHASDPASVHLSLAARLAAADPVAAAEEALYERRTLIRMHGMRRTVFVFPAKLAPVVEDAVVRGYAAKDRARFARYLAEELGWDEPRLTAAEDAVTAALGERGELSGAELSRAVPDLREAVVNSPGKPYERRQAIGSRLLRGLGMTGRIVRGRPLGAWTSGQCRWALGTPAEPGDAAAARAELLGRWLAAYGPATEADAAWWTGLPLGQVRRAFTELGAVPVRLDGGGEGRVLPGDADFSRPGPAAPRAALLPALDPTAMGWQERGFYLREEHRAALFDRSGNIGPTVWWGGRIVGGWAQRADGTVAVRLLEDPGRDAERGAAAAAEALRAVLGETRVTPRFRTPLERELSA